MEFHYQQSFLIGYGEVDEQNRLKLSALLNFLQDTATLHSKTLGYGTTECQELGIGWLLLSWQIRMYSYPKGDSIITVKTWCRKMKGIHAGRGYEVVDEQGNLVAQVDSIWALCNIREKKIIRPLPEMMERYGAIEQNFFENEKVRLTGSELYDSQQSFVIQRRDIDTNHHCNNTKYIDFALETIPEEWYRSKNVMAFKIDYRKPLLYEEKFSVTLTKTEENTYLNTIYKESGEVATYIQTVWQ